MNMSHAARAFLVVSGVVLIGVGGALLFVPVAFLASSGIDLGDNVNLLNEIRAPGGMLFAAGILVAVGAIQKNMARMSMVLSILIYMSYGASRILSIVVDGMPGDSQIAAAGIEIILGSLGVFLLVKLNRAQAMA